MVSLITLAAQAAYLDGEVSTIDIITQEQIPGIGRVSSDLEQLHQIVLLVSQVLNLMYRPYMIV